MIEMLLDIGTVVAVYVAVGTPICMVLAGDSLGGFPPWLLLIWPLLPILFVAEGIHIAYTQRKDES